MLNIAFKVADEQGLLLLDMKDLRAILSFVAEHAAELTTQYGNVSKQTVGTIQRQLLVLENQGGAQFFGEPALALKDFMRTDRDGRGMVNILVADKRDGKPLPDKQGPFRLVCPNDHEGARSVRMLQTLEVVRLAK